MSENSQQQQATTNELVSQIQEMGKQLGEGATFGDVQAYIRNATPLVNKVAEQNGKNSHEHIAAATIMAGAAVRAAMALFEKSDDRPRIGDQAVPLDNMPKEVSEEYRSRIHNAGLNAMDVFNKIDYLPLFPEYKSKEFDPMREHLRNQLSATEPVYEDIPWADSKGNYNSNNSNAGNIGCAGRIKSFLITFIVIIILSALKICVREAFH